jgi:hypothetical protein
MSSGSPKTQVIQLNFDGSMDQRTHPRQLQSPQVLGATNVRYPRIGAAEKRNGMSVVTSSFFGGSTMAIGQGKLLAHRDELVVIDGFNVGSLSELPDGTRRLIQKGKVPEATSTAHPIDSTQYSVSQADVSVGSTNLAFHVWAGNDRSSTSDGIPRYDIFWTVQNRTTGAEILSAKGTTGAFDAWAPRIVAVGQYAMMFWVGSGSSNIAVQWWDPATYTWSAATLVGDGSTAAGGPQYACCTDGTSVFLVYQQGTNNVRILKLNPINGTLISAITSTENLAPTLAFGFSICATPGERVWVSYARWPPIAAAVNIRASAYDLALSTQLQAPTTIYTTVMSPALCQTGICRLTSTSTCVTIWVHDTGLAIDGRANYTTYTIINNSAAVVGNASGDNRRMYWSIPLSMPFVASTNPLRCYMWLNVGGTQITSGSLPFQPPFQPQEWTAMLVDLQCDVTTNIDYVARPITWQSPRFSLPDYLGNLNGFPNGVNPYLPSSVSQAPDGDWVCDSLVRLNAGTRSGLQELDAKFTGPERFVGCSLGPSMVMTPGFYWDRKQFAEISFAYWPQTIVATPSATGGQLKNSKQYAYRALYEYVDGTGAVHRSKASETIVVSVPAGAGSAGSVSLVIPTLSITCRQGPSTLDEVTGVRIVVYRAGPLDSSDLGMYRVFSDIATPRNKPRQPTITVLDGVGGFDAAAEPRLQRDTIYTAGGVLENVMPPGFTSCVTFRNRVFILYGNTVAFSKFIVAGEAVSFTDSFTIPCEETGDLTAMWVMDDTLYFSTPERIYGIQGDGPSDAGTLTDFGTPSRVLSDRGCVDQRSVVVTPMGTIFQSLVGLQMLDRGRSVANEPIGARVQNDLAKFSETTAALIHPTNGTVTIMTRNPTLTAGTYSGVRLVYDYTTDRWSRDCIMQTSTINGHGAISEVVSRGLVWSLVSSQPGNLLCVETPGISLDNGQWVPMQIIMGEIHPQGLQGHFGAKKWQQNIERFTDHDLVLSWFHDYATTSFETRTIPSDTVAAPPIEQFSQNVSWHSAQSMRVVVEDSFPSGPGAVVGTGRGAAFIGLAVEVDPIDGKIYKLPAGQKS